MNDARRSELAFSLIEVLIAMVIFSVGALGALALTNYMFMSHADARNITEATVVGRSEMERVMGAPNPGAACTTACTDAATCSAACWRQLTGTGDVTGPVFQVYNLRAVTGGQLRVRVEVLWPKDRAIRSVRRGETGFVDCVSSSDRTKCKGIFFYNQR